MVMVIVQVMVMAIVRVKVMATHTHTHTQILKKGKLDSSVHGAGACDVQELSSPSYLNIRVTESLEQVASLIVHPLEHLVYHFKPHFLVCEVGWRTSIFHI